MEKYRDKYTQQENKDGDDNGKKLYIHPLLIDHVLDKIFDYIINDQTSSSDQRTKDLRSIRLVCKLWKDRVTSLFRQKRYRLDLMSLVVSESKLERMAAMERFLDVMENSSMIPYQKFFIDLAPVCKYKPELMQKFVRICLPETVSLTIKYTDLDSLEWPLKISTEFNCRVLEDLFVWVDPLLQVSEFELPSSQQRDAPPLLMHIFNSANNLENFNFGQSTGKAEAVMCGICKHIPKSVKFLTLNDFQFSDACLRHLIEAKLKLKSFTISFRITDCSSATICEFFKQQSETLTTLRLESLLMSNGATQLLVPRFPQLKKVRELFLSRVPSDFGASLSMSETFPAVVNLIVSEINPREFWEGLLTKARQVLSLEELCLPNYIPNADLISKFPKCFPNLKKLYVSTRYEMPEVLKQIFTHCVNIEELVISSDNKMVTYKDMDCVFSGIDKDLYQQIRTGNDYDNVDLESFGRRVSIFNLTKLKKLSLWGRSFDKISKFLCHFVLIKLCGLLESLDVMDFTANSIRRRYRTLLKTKLRISLSDPEEVYSEFEESGSEMDWSDSDEI